MTTSEKVAYLKGLAEGLGVDKETKEGRILDAILDILEDVAHDIEDPVSYTHLAHRGGRLRHHGLRLREGRLLLRHDPHRRRRKRHG